MGRLDVVGGTDKGAGPQKNSRKEHPTAFGETLVRPAIGRELGISTCTGHSGHHVLSVCPTSVSQLWRMLAVDSSKVSLSSLWLFLAQCKEQSPSTHVGLPAEPSLIHISWAVAEAFAVTASQPSSSLCPVLPPSHSHGCCSQELFLGNLNTNLHL